LEIKIIALSIKIGSRLDNGLHQPGHRWLEKMSPVSAGKPLVAQVANVACITSLRQTWMPKSVLFVVDFGLAFGDNSSHPFRE
jgi:hypothetical protein